jgi:flagellin-specific chaperone FliS
MGFDIGVARVAIDVVTIVITQLAKVLPLNDKARLRKALNAIYFTPAGSLAALKGAVRSGVAPLGLDNRRRDFLEASESVDAAIRTLENLAEKAQLTLPISIRTNLESVRYGKISARSLVCDLFQYPGQTLTEFEIRNATEAIDLIEELNDAILKIDDKL